MTRAGHLVQHADGRLSPGATCGPAAAQPSSSASSADSGTEHILLGLLRDSTSTGGRVVARLIDRRTTETWITAELQRWMKQTSS